MKKLILVAALLFALDARAAGETPVTQAPARQDSVTTQTVTSTVTTAATLTISAGPGCIYVSTIDFTVSIDGTGTGDSFTNLTFTTTGLGGWLYKFSAPTVVANTMPVDKFFVFGTPLKGLPGTAVTIASPVGKTHSMYNINASYFYGPCS